MPDDPQQSSPPRVSVLLSVYNGARYIEESLRSVLDQTFTDFEVLLYDDGSTDETPDILRRYAERDSRIDLRLRPHGNFVDHFNDGIRTARGLYVARADGDDLNEPTRFAEQVKFLDEHPKVVAVGSRVREIDPMGVELGVTGERDQPLEHAEIERNLLAGNGWAMSHPAATMRTAALRQIGGYNRDYVFAEDTDLFLRLAEIGELANLPEPLVRYRRHAKSVSSQNFEEQRRRFGRIIAEAHRRRGLPMKQEPAFFKTRPQPPEKLLELWGWNALRKKRADVARQHAGDRLRLRPLSWKSWKLWFCAARGW